MAEILVKIVLNKLSDVLLQEIFFLCGVKEKVEHVKRELTRIQCFLKDADRKHGEDASVQNWVNELRDVSHSIEDTVDLFVIEVEESSGERSDAKKLSMKEKVKRWLQKPEKEVRRHQLGKEIDKTLERIGEIAASRDQYGIKNLSESSGGGVVAPFKRLIIPDLDETELIGVNAEKEKVVAQLLDEKHLRRSVVSIVGTGGLGKSTIAAKAYSSDEVKSKFAVRIWLSISQSFTPINLLKNMLKAIKGSPESSDDQVELMTMANELLQKKYLVVLDDVWSENLWSQIDLALPDVKNGSRVLITSRFSTVPKAADPGSEPNELRFLTPKESLQLLLKTALRNRDGIESFVTGVSDIAKQLAHICDGLPLALVTLGGLLSIKPLTYHAWNAVSKTMVWSLQGKKCMDIITTSYNDMPIELKLCFMYLACYPEDHKIPAVELIRLWVAEGLILDTPGMTLEDAAEDYLEQLVQRSMIQVIKRSAWGSIKTCRLHDLMRDVAIQKAKEDNFLVVCSNSDVEKSYGRVRRVAAHHLDCEVMKHASSNLRSFLCFNYQTQNFSGHRLFRVLHFGDGTYKKIKLDRIGILTQLRYLKLAGTSSEENYEQYFRKLIGGHKYLQLLDVQNLTRNRDLPDCIWNVKTLRHIVARDVSGPPPSADLTNLQTLVGVIVPESWVTALPNLPNLRTLSIKNKKTSLWEVLVAFLRTLENLEHLMITSNQFSMKVLHMQTLPFFHHLKSLQFCSPIMTRAEMTELDAAMFPVHITTLSIRQIRINQDVLPMLEKLQELRDLILTTHGCPNHKIRCTARGFPKLEKLEINLNRTVREWEIEKGAMPRIKSLSVNHQSSGQVIQGREHLTALRKFFAS